MNPYILFNLHWIFVQDFEVAYQVLNVLNFTDRTPEAPYSYQFTPSYIITHGIEDFQTEMHL